MINMLMDFEKPVRELEQKIEELKALSEERNIDLSQQIDSLVERAENLKKRIYRNLTPWQRTQVARHPLRPYTLDYIKAICDESLELHGDRLFRDDKAIVGGFARFDGRPVLFVGHQKGRNTKENIERNFGMPLPEGYRKAMRLMSLAERYHRPVICFIDTPGAFCGIEAEERGQSEAIARNLEFMSGLEVPVVVAVIGEGGSGGAIGIGVGDRVLMLENSIYSVISPEGCAAILWKDASRAAEAADILRLTAPDLKAMNVIDDIIAEPVGGAHQDSALVMNSLKKALRRHLRQLAELTPDELLEQRYRRFRNLGFCLPARDQ